MLFCQPGFWPSHVFVTLTLSLSLLRCACKARENPLEGRDERLNCLLRFRPGCVLDPSPGLSPKSLRDFRERRNITSF